jgi:hypothetical protein
MLAGLICMSAVAMGAEGPVKVAESGPGRVSLVELYTSEGCSSCPPAEARLGELVTAKGLWNAFVPVAFHVDYWDNLGWKDGLASGAYTDRQQRYAAEAHATTVYTPEFVVDGREWRRDPEVTPAAEDRPGRLTVERRGNADYQVTFAPEVGFAGGTASVAILGFDKASEIGAGENAGRRLVHQFAVLTLNQAPLVRDAKTGAWVGRVTMADLPAGRLGVAAWVAADGSQAPVQAAGGWLQER